MTSLFEFEPTLWVIQVVLISTMPHLHEENKNKKFNFGEKTQESQNLTTFYFVTLSRA